MQTNQRTKVWAGFKQVSGQPLSPTRAPIELSSNFLFHYFKFISHNEMAAAANSIDSLPNLVSLPNDSLVLVWSICILT